MGADVRGRDKKTPRDRARKKRKRDEHTFFRYGNYHRYYGYRANAEAREDPRLASLARLVMTNKRVLDVGCNDGSLTIAMAWEFAPAKVLGVDVDEALVRFAREKLSATRRHAAKLCEDGDDEDDSDRKSGDESVVSAEARAKALSGVEFVCANATERGFGSATYDVALMLSVTKWMHLNWGDAGLKRAFKFAYDSLVPNGVLFVEPQPWRSYKQAFRKAKGGAPEEWKLNYGAIELKPDMFEAYLTSPEIGFRSIERVFPDSAAREASDDDDDAGATDGASAKRPSRGGFDREIFRCIK